jgi:anthranilate 1,2-dioxygenase small subunit
MQPAEAQAAVDGFNARYGKCLDDGKLEDWIEFFTDDARYTVIAREAHERGLPMGVMSCEGRNMFVDRAVATRKTLVFAPRYMRHIVSRAVVSPFSEGVLRAEASYVVYQTQVEKPTEIFQCGRYCDEFVLRDGALRLKQRLCIYDSTIIPNALIFPI